jgi:hypothetical protein
MPKQTLLNLEDLKNLKITSKYFLKRAQTFFKDLPQDEQVNYLDFLSFETSLDLKERIQKFIEISFEK